MTKNFPLEMPNKLIVIDGMQEMDRTEIQKMAAAMDMGIARIPLKNEAGEIVNHRVYHPRTRIIYLMAPRNRQDIEIEMIYSVLGKYWRHLSDITLDGDTIP